MSSSPAPVCPQLIILLDFRPGSSASAAPHPLSRVQKSLLTAPQLRFTLFLEPFHQQDFPVCSRSNLLLPPFTPQQSQWNKYPLIYTSCLEPFYIIFCFAFNHTKYLHRRDLKPEILHIHLAELHSKTLSDRLTLCLDQERHVTPDTWLKQRGSGFSFIQNMQWRSRHDAFSPSCIYFIGAWYDSYFFHWSGRWSRLFTLSRLSWVNRTDTVFLKSL